MVLSLEPYIGRLGLVAGGTSAEAFCQGLPEHMLRRLEALRNKPIQRWGQQQGEGGIDVWVSHKPPTRYPRFPYRGAVTVTQQPLFVIGRSMSEVHRVPSSWVRAVQEQVDEVWVPARASRDAFVSATEGMGGVGRVDEKQVHVIPEPIDAELFDAVTVAPLDAEKDLVGLKLRSFNFLSVFKMEERKGWRSLMRAWFEEFSEVDDVTLTLHTYLFNDFNSRDAQRIRQKIREFVETDLQQFPGRDLVARPLPWANLLIHTAELGAEDMPSFYATFSAFVLPTHGEGWGMPLMEAMAMGLPAIATNCQTKTWHTRKSKQPGSDASV
jgi:glycosyltransferase involved in cell wall biosynthesis